jgi:transposase-like protein
MEFPITDLLHPEECECWLLEHFHPDGLRCPRCGASVAQAHHFRRTRKSQLTVYRCNRCAKTYNLYSGTVFQQRHLTPQQVVLLMRGILKGEPSTVLAAELGVNYITVLELRRDLQDQAILMQPDTPLCDEQAETDEMFQNAGEKRRRALRSPGPAALSGQ